MHVKSPHSVLETNATHIRSKTRMNEWMNECNGFNSKRSLQCCANEPVTTGDNKISCKHKLTNWKKIII